MLGGNARSADGDRGVARLEDGGVAAHEYVSGFDGPLGGASGFEGLDDGGVASLAEGDAHVDGGELDIEDHLGLARDGVARERRAGR